MNIPTVGHTFYEEMFACLQRCLCTCITGHLDRAMRIFKRGHALLECIRGRMEQRKRGQTREKITGFHLEVRNEILSDLVSMFMANLCKTFFVFSERTTIVRSFLDKENCQLPVVAKLPRCISRPVPFERDRDFVGTNDVSLSRRRVKLCVLFESF